MERRSCHKHFQNKLFQVFFQLFCISKINLLPFIKFSVFICAIGRKMGTKYDEIISEIKGDLSEEEIYTRANESLHEDFLFLQESGLLNKDDLLQFIKKNGRNVDNVLDIKCCYEDEQHLVWKGLADHPDGKRYITTRMVVFRDGKRWRSIGTREEVSKNLDKLT